jgi:hypothetical protein
MNPAPFISAWRLSERTVLLENYKLLSSSIFQFLSSIYFFVVTVYVLCSVYAALSILINDIGYGNYVE